MAVADVLFLVLMAAVVTTVGNTSTQVLNSLVFQYNKKGPQRALSYFLLFNDGVILRSGDFLYFKISEFYISGNTDHAIPDSICVS